MNIATKKADPSPAIPRLAWNIDEVALSLDVSVVTVSRSEGALLVGINAP
jgi:hypothetical protein